MKIAKVIVKQRELSLQTLWFIFSLVLVIVSGILTIFKDVSYYELMGVMLYAWMAFGLGKFIIILNSHGNKKSVPDTKEEEIK